jgi:transcription antitermination protein NusB
MKTAQDPRHQHRIDLMQHLFSYSFGDSQIVEELKPILDVLTTIDGTIEKAAPEWPVAKIARIDLSILRLSVWELLYVQDTPPKVVIDEAVELAKAYGNDSSPGFINGALGSVLKHIAKPEEKG